MIADEIYDAFGVVPAKPSYEAPKITEKDHMAQLMVHICGAISENDLFSWSARYGSVSKMESMKEHYLNDKFYRG